MDFDTQDIQEFQDIDNVDNVEVLYGPVREAKFIDNGPNAGFVEGYGATFNGIDQGGDTILPGAFASSIARHQAAGTMPSMLWHHRAAEPVGRWTSMSEDGHGLKLRGKFNLDTSRGREAHAHVKGGDLGGISIGYSVLPGGSERLGPGKRLLKAVHVHEASFTAMPMDERARIVSVKTLGSKAELERLLQDAGLPRGACRKLARGGWPALMADDEEKPALPPTTDPALTALGKRLDDALLELKSLKGN